MDITQASVGSTLLALGVATFLLPGPRAPATPDDRDRLLQGALEALHQERFEDALTAAAGLRQSFPKDPAGALLAANVHQTLMRDYRLRDREAEFEEALGEAERLAEAALDRERSGEAYFARGSARGYRMLHQFRRGAWLPALRGALRSTGDLKRALAVDPAMVDPALGLALFDYWKAVKLPFGLFGDRRNAPERLRKVWSTGRYLKVEAAYSLETVLYREHDAEGALAVNEWLYARFPGNPVCLYHRALILEAVRRGEPALAVWDALVQRIETSGRISEGFLAECHLHRAELLRQSGAEAEARQALARAQTHVQRRIAEEEMEGPLDDFERVRERIAALARQNRRASLPRAQSGSSSALNAGLPASAVRKP